MEETTGRTIRVGELPSSSLSPAAVDLLYKALRKEAEHPAYQQRHAAA